jgi:5-methylthioadenosine/S-adenosylhomocysteine deaminase
MNLLIEHVDVLTLEPDRPLLRDVSIAIAGGRILAVGERPPLERFAPDETIDGRELVALPALWNAHCHAAMTLVRGWAEDLPFERWLNERIWRAESALEAEDVYWGTALACCEMIRAGVAGFADHYFHMDQAARAVEESGLRALLAWCFFGRARGEEVGGAGLDESAAFARRWQGQAGGRIRTALGPHSPYMCPPDALRGAGEAARALGVPVHLHLAESDEQVRVSRESHGRAPVAHLEACGVLEGPTLAAHCLALDDAERSLLAARGVHVARTPKTYLKLAMQDAPLGPLLDAGVRVALGSDGPASSSDLNLLEVLRLVGLLEKGRAGDAAAMPVDEILELACAAGARALGFASSGRIATGAAADLALLDTRGPHWCPRHDLAAGVVYTSHPADVRHLIVDGRVLLRDGALTTLDEDRIRAEVERRARRMTGGQELARLRTYRG